jgi:hypothetical protein
VIETERLGLGSADLGTLVGNVPWAGWVAYPGFSAR